MKSRLIRAATAVSVLFISLSLFSCDLDESDRHLSGGILLDDELMSVIKNDVLNGETLTIAPDELESTENNALENASEATSEEINWDEYEGEVYWTKSGTVWHISKNCSSLKKSHDIISGSVNDAKEGGKERACSRCTN